MQLSETKLNILKTKEINEIRWIKILRRTRRGHMSNNDKKHMCNIQLINKWLIRRDKWKDSQHRHMEPNRTVR
jgi:hypothetical protein